jgi:hypothetical protein
MVQYNSDFRFLLCQRFPMDIVLDILQLSDGASEVVCAVMENV